MTLTRRLWLLGVLVPSLAALAALVVAGQLFRYDLESALDQALLTQAAVESLSVSLFEGSEKRASLNMAMYPLLEQVKPFAPRGELFSQDGRLLMHHPPLPEETAVTASLKPGDPQLPPQLSTHTLPDGTRVREAVVSVLSPQGELYALRLTATLAQVDGSVRGYYRRAFTMAALLGSTLLVLQTLLARRMASRLSAITRHLTLLREGNFSQVPASDGDADEIGQLRDVLAEVTDKLRGAREEQDRLIADAAHELRTPLSLMRTRMDLALRRERGTEEMRAFFRDARGEVDRLAVLAGELLELAAAGRGEWDRKKANLAEVVAQSVEAARAEAEERGLIIRLESPRREDIWFDPSGVRRAVDNLLSNALKFSPKGGEIHVRLWRERGCACISVADEGPGIPPDQKEAVFAPFRKLSSTTPGAGLGLAIVREVARRHGGRVWVETARIQGTEVVLELPVRYRI
ncbi:HAMP domain-containing sensor histidine kinase [Stigmatella aurantiaca]|uniref:histidine kinase n=1 Tax=Stigmatella aurantiaca (strain DW4/3-1) TaxID=378806 RepID=Q09AY1_STIAD|nr:HAMP domain-containing sensor histidine kinase [Stigmatella aurantiaca]ADO72397.1 Sensor protein [Stigmatella aurantiaca DW4/3-1]EAU68847.1 two-component system, sensor protein [Stigmatella aurantiaca DW4/3-1]